MLSCRPRQSRIISYFGPINCDFPYNDLSSENLFLMTGRHNRPTLPLWEYERFRSKVNGSLIAA